MSKIYEWAQEVMGDWVPEPDPALDALRKYRLMVGDRVDHALFRRIAKEYGTTPAEMNKYWNEVR